jgi:hypothetical protein
MDEQIITVFCLCDDLLKALGIRDDPQVKMSNAEIMTTALSAALFFGCNYERSRNLLAEQGYIPGMLSKSRFNRRLNAIPHLVWLALFQLLAVITTDENNDQEYVLDSFPIPVCDNIRISRCNIYSSEQYRGYIASKKRYFYGLRVHLLIAQNGAPVEFLLAPGGFNDCRVMKQFNFDVPEGSTIYADKAYNDYGFEDLMKDADISLAPLRKKNSLRAVPGWVTYLRHYFRQRIETTVSQITALFPKVIHAVIPQGFELKIVLFIIAFAIQCL